MNSFQPANSLPVKGQLIVRISEIIDFSSALAESNANGKSKKSKKEPKKKKGVGVCFCIRVGGVLIL
jgi:hypothetical protein